MCKIYQHINRIICKLGAVMPQSGGVVAVDATYWSERGSSRAALGERTRRMRETDGARIVASTGAEILRGATPRAMMNAGVLMAL